MFKGKLRLRGHRIHWCLKFAGMTSARPSPRRHWMAERRSAKVILQRSQVITVGPISVQEVKQFSCKKKVASLAIPPVADRTTGVKEACSISSTLLICSLLHFFVSSVCRLEWGVLVSRCMRVEHTHIHKVSFIATTP